MYIRNDTKAKIEWTFKDKEYLYSTVKIILKGEDLIIEFLQRAVKNEPTKLTFTIQGFKNKTAIQACNEVLNGNGGRHCNNGIMTVYNDLDLNLGYVKPILKDF